MKRAAIISAILENPKESQRAFNETVSEYNDIMRGRMGIPFPESQVALIALTVVAELDQINTFTGKLGKLHGVTVRASIASADIQVGE